MCSRCRISWGASRHMTSIASWSPRKSEPLTVSKAWLRQSSAGLMAALMPPAAATEWERTGWTLLMIATVAPASAAARAARWPARPARMMRTSCEGMAPGFKGSGWAVHHIRRRPSDRPSGHPAGRGGGEGATHLIDGHDAAQDAVAVDHHQGPEAAQRLRGKQRLERRVVRDLRLAIACRLEQVRDRQRRAT